MKTIIKLEELLMLALCLYAFSQLSYSWWWFAILFLSPDIGMVGYLANSKIGAVTYNIFHHKGVAIVIWLLGFYFTQSILQLIGIIIFSHSSFDRILGYGLKYPDSFKNTHLGVIGRK